MTLSTDPGLPRPPRAPRPVLRRAARAILQCRQRRTAALARMPLDLRDHGAADGAQVIKVAAGLVNALKVLGIPVFETMHGPTQSQAHSVPAHDFAGGQAAFKHLYRTEIIAWGIDIMCPGILNDMRAIRIGMPEMVRWGLGQGTGFIDTLTPLIRRAHRSDTPRELVQEAAAFP